MGFNFKSFFSTSQNKLLPLILITSLWLNTTGLVPNTFFHQNEPGLLGPSDKLFKNIVTRYDFDPYIPPDAFKYASILFYQQAFTRGTALYLIYETNKLTGFDFGKSKKVFDGNLTDFISGDGPVLFENQILAASRLWGVFFGTGSVYLTYLITIKLFRRKTIALLSAAALAIMPLHVRNSHYALADMPQVFFFALSFLTSFLMYEKQKTKYYLLAGLAAGFATSLKYFPMPLLPFLIFHLLTGKKNWLSRNFFSALLAIFVGYWAGMPYLFVHFNEIIGFIPYALTWYGPDKLEAEKSIFEKLLPHSVHAYHLKFLWKDALLPIPFIASLSGLIYGLRKFAKPTLLVLIIPLANSIFIFFYVKQIYEQLSMPMLPFLSVFIGLCAYALVSIKKIKKIFLIAAVILILYIPSFIASAKASLACATPINEYQSRQWVRENIPPESNFAFEPGSRLPIDMKMNWILSELTDNFSLSELQEQNAQYLMLMGGYFGVNLSWSYDSLFPPENVLDNQYVQLAINEYKDSAILLRDFIKPYMCISDDIYIYRIPPKLAPAAKEIKHYAFEKPAEFKLSSEEEEARLTPFSDLGLSNSGALRYEYANGKFDHWRNEYYFFYVTPVFSEFLPIQPGKKYTLNGKVFPEKKYQKKYKDFFLRIDFYSEKAPVLTKKVSVYNEQASQSIKTALSPRANRRNDWQKLEVTSIAPNEAKFATVGFQAIGSENSQSYLVDDLSLYEE